MVSGSYAGSEADHGRNDGSMRRIAVVGGGIAGLATAYRIVERARKSDGDVRVDLFESESRLGGHLQTVRQSGFLIEGGPDCFVSQKPGGLRIVADLGLGNEVVNTRAGGGRTFVVSGGELHPLPDGVMLMVPTKFLPMVTSRLLSWPAKIRMGLDLLVPRGGTGDETLGAFVRRRLGSEALELIAEPLVAGVHAGDPDRLSLRSTFPRFKGMEEKDRSLIAAMIRARRRQKTSRRGDGSEKPSAFVTFRYGIGTLPAALEERLENSSEVSVFRNSPVERLSATDDGWTVVSSGSALPGQGLRYDDVVVATPAHAAGALLADGYPSLASELSSIEAVSAATVSLGFRRSDVRHALDGFGMVVPRRESRPIMGVTFSSQKFPGRAPDGHFLFRAFVGGVKGAQHLNLGDEQLIGLVRRQLADLLGVSARPVISKLFRWQKAMPQYNVGHAERVERIFTAAAATPGLHLTGSSYRGIGIPDCATDAERVVAAIIPEAGG